jgi:hypothetical protein
MITSLEYNCLKNSPSRDLKQMEFEILKIQFEGSTGICHKFGVQEKFRFSCEQRHKHGAL